MNFPQAIDSCFKKYVTFSGRILNLVTKILDYTILDVSFVGHGLHPINFAFSLLIILPGIAVAVRRMHDVNRSGWWLLIELTIIGIIYPILVWKCTKGTTGQNEFGSDPLAS